MGDKDASEWDIDKAWNELNALREMAWFIQMMRNHPVQPVQSGPTEAEDTVGPELVEERDVVRLLVRMRQGTSRSEKEDWILDECKRLFRKDYICRYVDNLDNNLPGVHPKVLVIPIAQTGYGAFNKTRMNFDVVEYLKHEQETGNTNVSRFPCPVILCNGRYVCRSRYPLIVTARRDEPIAETSSGSGLPIRLESRLLKMIKNHVHLQKGYFAGKDVDFLKSVDVKHLFDLSNSTECDFKGDITNTEMLRNIYERIEIISMPLPSRENFTPDSIEELQEITKFYFYTLLQKFVDGEGGILIQSYRGRNRAALFTSLLRVSFWADGLAHTNMDLYEFMFLTLAYDWYLFGYVMHENETPFQDVLEFFFHFLKSVASDQFSMYRMLKERGKVNEDSDFIPKIRPSRHRFILDISERFLECLDKSKQYMNSFNNPTD